MVETNNFLEARLALDELRSAVRGLENAFRGLETFITKPLNDLDKSALQSTDKIRNLNGELSKFGDSVEKNFARSISNAIKNGDSFLGFFDKARSALEDFVIQTAVVNPALNSLFGGDRGELADFGSAATRGSGGLFGSALNGILGLFEARAFGGPVTSGSPYLVGEKGPELFVPQTAGNIVPNGAGNAPISITMNISTNDAASFGANQTQIAAAMMDAARRAQRIR